MSLGLGALGIVTYVVGSIENEIQAAFSSLVPHSSIVMESRDDNASPIGNVYAGRIEDAAMITDEYPDLVLDYGTCLSLDYENWFIDDNYFSYAAGSAYQILPGFGVRHINDFLWYQPSGKEMVYPRAVTNMREDQVILGLPYASMFSICLSFHIERSFQSLGDYISRNGWNLILHASHIEWGFEDEELFEVVGVIQSDVPLFYHTDHRWNSKILLDHMKFRSSQTEEVPSPQYVLEIPYLELNCELEEFRKLARKEEYMSRFVFEHVSASYHPSFCQPGKRSPTKRLFLYSCDKSGVSWDDLDTISSTFPVLEGRNVMTNGGYYSASTAIMNGFLGKAFLSSDPQSILEVTETYSDLPLEQAELSLDLPENVFDASYLGLGDRALRISASLPSLLAGRMPEGLEECVLSEELFLRLGKPKMVTFALEIEHEEIGERYHRDFRDCLLKVVGVAKEEFSTMFVVSDWTADAPFALLEMSPFFLEPVGAVFFLKQGSSSTDVVDDLNKAYPKYRFSDPSEEIGSSVSSTMDYISVILYAFSAIAVAMSALLFLITLALSISESAHEGKLLFALGLPRSSISRLSLCQCLLQMGVGGFAALALTLGAQFGVKAYLGNAFGSGIRGTFSFFPFLWIGIAFLAFFFIASLYLTAKAKYTKYA